MADVLQMPGRARVALGAFVAGAGSVGLLWALTTRTTLPTPPEPEPFVLRTPAVTSPTTDAATPESASVSPPPAEGTPAGSEPAPERPPGTLTPEQWARIGPTYHPSPADRPATADAPADAPTEAYPVVYLDEHASRSADPSGSEPATPAESPGAPSAIQLIEINRADAAELQLLPGIGPVLAKRIVDDRSANGPFLDADDLQRVKGIGEKTAAKLAPMITFR
ncbi:MAG: ComEA family DNA-binding protein [Phycisphaerales bacterium JB040]